MIEQFKKLIKKEAEFIVLITILLSSILIFYAIADRKDFGISVLVLIFFYYWVGYHTGKGGFKNEIQSRR